MAAQLSRISDGGQITLPLDIRASLGLERGGPVTLEIVDGDLRVRKAPHSMDHARALTREIVAGHPGVSVDDFLADRRRESEADA